MGGKLKNLISTLQMNLEQEIPTSPDIMERSKSVVSK